MRLKTVFQKAGHTLSKYSPEIFTGAGLVGFAATAYTAYKAKEDVEVVVEDIERKRDLDQPLDHVEVAKDLAVALYIPITIGVLSGASILMAHRIQRKRIFALTGALAAQQAQNLYFEKKYRKVHGDEEYEQFAVPTEQIEREEKAKNGKTVKKVDEVKKEIDKTIGQWYDESSEYAADDHSYNVAYIDSVNETLQTRLFQRGNLLLNEVREELGFERVRAGALLGWTTADNFDLRKTVTNLGDENMGELKQQIFVSWSKPRYIYDDMEFNNRYSSY